MLLAPKENSTLALVLVLNNPDLGLAEAVHLLDAEAASLNAAAQAQSLFGVRHSVACVAGLDSVSGHGVCVESGTAAEMEKGSWAVDNFNTVWSTNCWEGCHC